MKRFHVLLRFASIACFLFCAGTVPAQSLIPDGSESGDAQHGSILRGGEIVLSQTASQAIDFSGIGCGNSTEGYTRDQSFWRLFDLSTEEEIEEAFHINSVDVGLGIISYDGVPEQTGEVILHELTGDFRVENLSELSRTPFALASDLAHTRTNVEVGGVVVPKDTRLVVEVAFPDCSGFETGTCAFYPGVNSEGGAGGTMGQWYITSDACELPQPMGVVGWVYGDQWWVLNVRGVEGTSTAGESEVGVETLALDMYPNPVEGEAKVMLILTEAGPATVAVYDVLGRAIAVLHEGPLAAGEHALSFEAAGLPAGLYLVRAEGKDFTASRRVTVVR
jgi:hypothetical protein